MSARLYRFLIRAKVAAGYTSFWNNQISQWIVSEFVQDLLPNLKSCVILVGTPGPTQKLIVQLWDGKNVVGYLKYAEKPAARVRLKNEYQVLLDLPKGLAPIPLKYGAMGDGEALLSTPVFGRAFSPTPYPVKRIVEYFNGLKISGPLILNDHPWIRMYAERNENIVQPWLDVLSRRKWSIVFSHGDSAPWNIFNLANGNVQAIDWEYGTCQGFPQIDIVQYILQVAALIYRWSPQQARNYAVNFLCRSNSPLRRVEAQSVVCFAAYHGYMQALEDGQSPDASLQIWRRAVWEGSM
ncbi:MAG TPA: hypothetical protein PKK23_02845 [Nitrospirales bacterium]|nr:hypothetical protein [Nitrospirales bacterium]